MIDLLKNPWHWSIAGIMIGLTVPTLLLLGNKKFGVSSSLRHICAMCVPAKIPFFQYEWRKELWNMFFVVGVFIGGYIGAQFLTDPSAIVVADSTKSSLMALGVQDFTHLMPYDIFSVDNIFNVKGLIFFVIGGFLVGFGTRYAGGCTSGHSIMGLSSLQLPSLIATCCFMIGGFFSANILIPYLLKLIA